MYSLCGIFFWGLCRSTKRIFDKCMNDNDKTTEDSVVWQYTNLLCIFIMILIFKPFCSVSLILWDIDSYYQGWDFFVLFCFLQWKIFIQMVYRYSVKPLMCHGDTTGLTWNDKFSFQNVFWLFSSSSEISDDLLLRTPWFNARTFRFWNYCTQQHSKKSIIMFFWIQIPEKW